MSATLTASWPAPALLTSLSRAGWGTLAGREAQGVRSVLRGLVDLLPHGSAQGHVTAWQVSETAGLSERWVRECLRVLEDAGLITWRRGGVIAGQPTPSYVRIHKRAIVDLIRAARQSVEAIRAEHLRAVRERVATLRFAFRDRRSRRSAHAALSGSPHPYGEGVPSPTPSRKDSINVQEPYDFSLCEHGSRAGLMPTGLHWCPVCRRSAAATPPAPKPVTVDLFGTADVEPDYAMRAAGDR